MSSPQVERGDWCRSRETVLAARAFKEILSKAPEGIEERKRWWTEVSQPVRVKPKIEHPDIAKESFIRRFVDLPKLLDLLVHQRLFLPQLQMLSKHDPFECSAKRTYDQMSREQLESKALELRPYAPEFYEGQAQPLLAAALGNTIKSSSYWQAIQRMSDQKLREALWFLDAKALGEDVVCSCWYLGESTESEDAMWKVYCGQLGVCIRTSVATLKSAVSCVVPKFMVESIVLKMEKVIYEDRAECGNTEPWLVKRKAFEHEHEVRLYLESPFIRGPGFSLLVNPEELIEEIVITPFAEEWHVRSITETCEALFQLHGIGRINSLSLKPKISKSRHMKRFGPVWPEEETILGSVESGLGDFSTTITRLQDGESLK